ncbi:MAG: zinc ribbon domain-containing protein [Candidatus Aureabacteria bacterium]|nr:zinc ribbon domain-containing protein [Candidatus Auribacterota bacterium]
MKAYRRNNRTDPVICPICSHLNERDQKSCESCHADLTGMTVCGKCSYEQSIKNNFCRKCYSPLKKNVKFHTVSPSHVPIPEKKTQKTTGKLLALLLLPLIAFVILIRIPSPKAQLPALLLMIISTFFLIKRSYQHR